MTLAETCWVGRYLHHQVKGGGNSKGKGSEVGELGKVKADVWTGHGERKVEGWAVRASAQRTCVLC